MNYEKTAIFLNVIGQVGEKTLDMLGDKKVILTTSYFRFDHPIRLEGS